MILRWWDWLTMPSPEIEEVGCDPRDRFERTGHKAAMSVRWARTVGCWVVESPKDIMKSAGLDPSNRLDRGKYDFFKTRRRLRSATQAPADLADGDASPRILLAESAFVDVSRALEGIEPHLKVCTFGDSVQYAGDKNFILPIEAAMYYWSLLAVLDYHSINVDAYAETEERWKLWGPAGVGPRLPAQARKDLFKDDEEDP